jgi:uncharacterized protein (TIGR04255 family)
MYSRRNYANPPLVEALCQIQFKPGREWDNTVPGLLYAAIRDEYPERRQKRALEFQVGDNLSDITRTVADWTQFLRSDHSAIVQVSVDTVVVNMLRPYKGWEQFREAIRSVFRSYCAVSEPTDVHSLALRYINRIVPPAEFDIVEHESYLTFYPRVPDSLPQTLGRWTQSVDILLPEAVLRLTSGTSYKDQSLSLVLDIEVVGGQGAAADQVDDYLDRFHAQVEQAFEESITPKARALFEEEEMPHERVG